MTPPWSPLANLSIASVAISQFSVAAAAAVLDARQMASGSEIVPPTSTDTLLRIISWIGDGYHRAPMLVLVLTALVVLPPLAVAGLALRRQRRSPDSTVLISRPSLRTGKRGGALGAELSAWPTEAWIDAVGQRYVIGRAMLRIGREADNDICLAEKTVHRYHAVIRRSTDGEVIVTDVSGAGGNGVLVNGGRVGEGRLKPGDVITIGEVRLNFDERPI